VWPASVEVATALKRIFTFVAELVAFVWMHPTAIVEVEFATLVAVMVDPVIPPPTVRLPCSDRTPADVVVALPPTHREPPMFAELVVEEFESVVLPVTPSVVENVADVPERPALRVTVPSVLKVEVAVPPNSALFAETTVVLARLSEERPVTANVPPVLTFVLMVVAAWVMPAPAIVTASARTRTRVVLPRLSRNVLMRFI